jgi:hypothetical protein
VDRAADPPIEGEAARVHRQETRTRELDAFRSGGECDVEAVVDKKPDGP